MSPIRSHARVLLVIVLLACALPSSASDPGSVPGVAPLSGQRATLLPDGRWLLTGGESATGPVPTAWVWDSRTAMLAELPSTMSQARAWHSATVLPDGSVLIAGGRGRDGAVVDVGEVFDPARLTFVPTSTPMTVARAGHTTTVLIDGSLLIVGGALADGTLAGEALVWNPESGAMSPAGQLTVPRFGHTARTLEDGRILISGGSSAAGTLVADDEVYDIESGRFVPATGVGEGEPTPPGARLSASFPAAGTADVALDARIGLRFSGPLRVDTVTAATFTLRGPAGGHAAAVVPTEGGLLVFVTPATALLPGAVYTLEVDGVLADDGSVVEPFALSFSTAPLPFGTGVSDGSPGGAVPVTSGSADGTPQAAGGDEPWYPPPGAVGSGWTTGRPDSPWRSLPPLEAPPGVTALAGQVLRLNGEPLADVTLAIRERTTRTDATGRFLLTDVAPGTQTLLIDGRTANRPGATYGIFEVKVTVVSGQTSALPYTVWMPRLDTAHAVSVPAYTTTEVVVTTPLIPGLELHIPAHAWIRDHEGKPVTEISITPIPLDRTPFPLPAGDVPIYFTIQPGGAYVATRNGTGARLIYPNAAGELVGTRFSFWHYDPAERGWYVYGLGTVADGGRQVVPDPGVELYEFTGAMIIPPGEAPPEWPVPGNAPPPPDDGDPVDLRTGLFVQRKTDLHLPGPLPITLTRTYRTRDTRSRPFGIGATHPYELLLIGDSVQWQWVALVLPDGTRIEYPRTSPGTTDNNFEGEHTSSPTIYYKSRVTRSLNPLGWHLTRKDGTVYFFADAKPLQWIRDRNGNTLTLTRDAIGRGRLLRIDASSGRWIEFTYDASSRITQARDNLGRTVAYTYDGSGRLWKVTDPAGGVTEYTYDTAHRMLTLKDPRAIVFLTNEYDASGKVSRQTQADGTTYQFAYTLDGSGTVIQTDVTNPRGYVRRLAFDTAGYTTSETRALGTPVAQTTTLERQAGTNFITALVDPLGRRTTYAYDALGNRTAVTRLAGTPEAVTTTFTYEPAFNQVASITDPLSHTTAFGHDAQGNLASITDPLGNQTALAYNVAGQVTAITNPLGHVTQFAYDGDAGDLRTVTDPLGNVTTRFVDAVGRLGSLRSPLGHLTRYEYDALGRLTRITDALGGTTDSAYDPNGNLLSVTDARGNATAYTYNSMDRLATRTDPLGRAESYGYDANGNLTSFTDRKSQVTSTTYDALDRVTQRTYADASTTTYTWDAGNRLTQLVDSISGTITRTYDGLDRLTQETTPQGTVSYTYDAAGRRTSMTVTGQATVNYAYDNANRLAQITQGTATVSFTYDAAGRRTALTLPNGVITDYAYDTASRLTGLTYRKPPSTLGTLTYAYDAAGNRTALAGTWARTGLPQPVASATYDAANRQLTFGSQILAYDFNGNLTGDGALTYTWDARNRLASLGGATTASFQYDQLGRRTRKTINAATTDFLFDHLNPIHEIGGTSVELLTGLGIDEFLTRTDVSGTRAFLTDPLGSTVALADSGGTVETSYTYEPFGKTTVTGASGNQFRFTGREDDATGLYHYRARYYHPGLGRFISEDPIGLAGGDVNLYAYVGNNPTVFIDPFGLDPNCCPDGRRRDALDCYSRCVHTLLINPAGYLANLLVFGSASSIGASRLPSGERLFVAAGRAVGRAFGSPLRGAVEGLRLLNQVTITAGILGAYGSGVTTGCILVCAVDPCSY